MNGGQAGQEPRQAASCGCLKEFSNNVADLWAPRRVARISRPITALEFLRDYVQSSVPVVFEQGAGLLEHWQ